MSSPAGYARPAIAGSGTIACGLAACASTLGEVRLLARSDASARRAEERAGSECGRIDGGDPARIRITTEMSELADCDVVVEAIREDTELKNAFLAELGRACPDADLASTTSSLSIAGLAEGSGHRDRLYGLHVFNPVTRMELVELCLPQGLREGAAERARAWCEGLGKRWVEVPDEPGFVVNRLLFPFLFDAVRMLERTGMDPAEIDTCMTLGTGQPMGPLRLLDFVGLDVAEAIGDALYADSADPAQRPPGRLISLIREGRLGKKTGAGFYDYGEEG